jgi:hypothetical protein
MGSTVVKSFCERRRIRSADGAADWPRRGAAGITYRRRRHHLDRFSIAARAAFGLGLAGESNDDCPTAGPA